MVPRYKCYATRGNPYIVHFVLLKVFNRNNRSYEAGDAAFEEIHSLLRRGDIVGVVGIPGELFQSAFINLIENIL
jgi:hypothetical protein